MANIGAVTLVDGRVILEGRDSTGVGLTYRWSVESGPALAVQDRLTARPSFEHPTAGGSFVFVLTVEDVAGQTASDRLAVTLDPKLVVHVQELGLTASFATNRPGVSHQWEFGDGNRSDASAPLHRYAAAGTYTATVTVMGSHGPETATVRLAFAEDAVPLAMSGPTTAPFALGAWLVGAILAGLAGVFVFALVGRRRRENKAPASEPT